MPSAPAPLYQTYRVMFPLETTGGGVAPPSPPPPPQAIKATAKSIAINNIKIFVFFMTHSLLSFVVSMCQSVIESK